MPEVDKYKGSTVRVWGRFWDADTSEPADPPTLTLISEDPDGEVASPIDYPHASIVRLDTGVYYFKLPLVAVGRYRYMWEAAAGTDDATVVMGTVNSVTRGNL
jgi:hypothetical protein